LWWAPGAESDKNLGVDLLSATLGELQSVLAAAGGGEGSDGGGAGGEGCSVLEPIQSSEVAVAAWASAYVLSGARLLPCDAASRQGSRLARQEPQRQNASSVAVYRFTPRCLSGGYCTQGPPPVNGTVATFRIGSGFDITPVPNGRLFFPSQPTSTLGFWIVIV